MRRCAGSCAEIPLDRLGPPGSHRLGEGLHPQRGGAAVEGQEPAVRHAVQQIVLLPERVRERAQKSMEALARSLLAPPAKKDG
jgi:hypothetical protein